MLLSNQKYKSGDIISIKISNGDEIVAKFSEETSTGFIIVKPMIVVTTQKGVALMPALFTAVPGDNTISFNHIMLHGPSEEQIKTYYISQTTGIQTIPKSNIII